MRRILTFLFAALMSVGMFALTPKGTDTWDEGTKTLTLNGNPGDYAYYGGYDIENLVISDAVTSIGGSAFMDCQGLTSVTIGNNVESIAAQAFFSCTGLTSVTIGNSVISIGAAAFGGCASLTSIVVASGNTKYDSRDNCNAIIEKSTNTLIAGCKNTIIPNGVTSIGMGTFYGCTALTSITIPNSVASIGNYAFYYCTALQSIYINATTPPALGDGVFANVNEDLSTIPLYVPSGSEADYQAAAQWNEFNIQAIPDEPAVPEIVNPVQIGDLYYNLDADNMTAEVTSMPSGKYTGDIIIPASVDYNSVPFSVTSIGDDAFVDCHDLTSITIPNSVTSIGGGAFYYCI